MVHRSAVFGAHMNFILFHGNNLENRIDIMLGLNLVGQICIDEYLPFGDVNSSSFSYKLVI